MVFYYHLRKRVCELYAFSLFLTLIYCEEADLMFEVDYCFKGL